MTSDMLRQVGFYSPIICVFVIWTVRFIWYWVPRPGRGKVICRLKGRSKKHVCALLATIVLAVIADIIFIYKYQEYAYAITFTILCVYLWMLTLFMRDRVYENGVEHNVNYYNVSEITSIESKAGNHYKVTTKWGDHFGFSLDNGMMIPVNMQQKLVTHK